MLRKISQKLKKNKYNGLLLYYVMIGDLTKVKIYLTKGANINAKDSSGKTALMLAAKFDHEEIVKYLLSQSHINIDVADEYNCTALMIADRYGHQQIIKYLLQAGANIVDRLQIFENHPIEKNEYSCLIEMRKNARVLDQSIRDPNSSLRLFPKELLVEIVSLTNTQTFDNRTRYKLAHRFFKRPPTLKKDIIKEEKDILTLKACPH